jgi:hypothetical protein
MRKLMFVMVPVLMAGLFALPGTAEAKKKGGVIAYGDLVVPVGPLPNVEGVTKEVHATPQLAGAQAGFKCKALVVLFAQMHKWGCEPVLVRGDTYWAPQEQPVAEIRNKLEKLTKAIAAKYSPGDAKIGFWAKHGRIFIVLGILGLIGYGVWSQMGKGKKKKDKKDKA